MIFLIILLSTFIWIHSTASSQVNDVLKPEFLRYYQQTCLKYPFVDRYTKRIEDPDPKYMVYEFSHSGLGDRMAGINFHLLIISLIIFIPRFIECCFTCYEI